MTREQLNPDNIQAVEGKGQGYTFGRKSNS